MLNKALPLFFSAFVISLTAAPAYSQEGFEEIVVTATKRQSTLQEVPVAVSVTDSQTIQQAQILDILDLQTSVPSLRVTQLQSSGNTNFVIRGFGNGANNPGIEPSVAVFIDGVYRSRSAAALSDLPNLERVEVLRGPQSTLFGKNASAGVISVVTALPDEEFGGMVEAVVGNFGQTALKGYVSGPISDNVGFSLGASINQRDGFITDIPTGIEYNERDRWSIRGQLAFAPTDSFSLRFIADYDEIDELCCGLANILSGPASLAIKGVGGNLVEEDPFSRTSYINFSPTNEVENSGISMQADFDLANSTITSITAFRNVQRIEDFDADFTSADVLSRNWSDTDIDTFTQEIRWASNSGETFDWMVGGFFFDEDVNYDTELFFGADTRLYVDLLAGQGVPGTLGAVEAALGLPAGIFFADGAGVAEITGQANTATSFFGTIDFYAGDRSTISLGINYTQDEKDAFVGQTNTNVFSQVDFVAAGFAGAFMALTGGAAPTPANFALFPVQFATAQFLSVTQCSATNPPPGCNSLLALQPLQVLPPAVGFPNVAESGNSDDSDTTWTLRYAFDVTDDVNMYVSASTGFKATSWNLSRDTKPFPADIAAITAAGLAVPNMTSGTRFAAPEEATVYELGLKARFERGAVNIAVFDQSIEGFQSNIFTGTGFNLANAGEQSTFGIELDATMYPTDDLKLTFAGTFLDPTYDSFVGAEGPDGPVDLSGTRPAGVHSFSGVAAATYDLSFSNGMGGFFRIEYLHESGVQVVENISESIAAREVNVLNASFGVSTDSGWDFTLWGRNLTDDEFLLSAAPGVFQLGSFSGYPNPPRTYGVTARKNF